VLLRDFQGSQRLTTAQLLKARHYYYARVAFADFEIGRLIEWIRSHGLLENTIIAMTADHGTDLGDHGLLQKQSFYEQVVTVPYLFSWPGMARKGVRLRRPVNTVSLLPTLLKLTGQPVPAVEAPTLESSVARGDEPAARPVFSELEYGYQKYRDTDRQVMIRDTDFKLSLFMKRGDPPAFAASADGELYDLTRDPLERNNLFKNRKYNDTAARLQSQIVEWDRDRAASGTGS
jgi:arylsulfatase A-like enzyme